MNYSLITTSSIVLLEVAVELIEQYTLQLAVVQLTISFFLSMMRNSLFQQVHTDNEHLPQVFMIFLVTVLLLDNS